MRQLKEKLIIIKSCWKIKMSEIFFGKKLKEFRLKYAKKGLRGFSVDIIKMCPSEYSKIERGLVPPPPCKKWIYGVIDLFNLEHDSSEALELYNLWAEPFVMQKMSENIVISPLTSKTDGTQLTTEEFINLNKHINAISKKHNKVAEKYNEEHFGKKRKDI